jgi:hypothetical protein
MSALFGRQVSLIVSAPNAPPLVKASFNDSPGVDLSGLDIKYSVRRTLTPHPNVAQIEVYNLTDDTRKSISGEQNLEVSLAAGYQGQMEQIFFSDARAAWTERQGPDWITHIEAGDGDKAMKARTRAGLGGRISVQTALNAIVKALGVGQGNVGQLIAALGANGFTTISGSAITGSAARCLTDFTRSAGLEWSIQNGNLQIMTLGQATRTQAIVCSVDTGMVNSPTVDSHGLLSVTMLITPGLVPGGIINVKSLFYKGYYRITRCHWEGEVRGQNWYCHMEAEKYAAAA